MWLPEQLCRALELTVAAQVVLAQTQIGEHAPHESGVLVGAHVRRGDDGHLARAPAPVVDRAVLDPGALLERLRRRTPEGDEVGVPVALDLASLSVDDRRDDGVQALDRLAAPDLDRDGIALLRTLGSLVPGPTHGSQARLAAA